MLPQILNLNKINMKEQLIQSIQDFKKKWTPLGYKGWLADTLIAIVNLIGLTEDEKKNIADDVKNKIPVIQMPKEFFSEEDKIIEGKEYRVITVSKEFNDRLKSIEEFISKTKELL